MLQLVAVSCSTYNNIVAIISVIIFFFSCPFSFIYFSHSRQCDIAGCERIPPVQLGWYFIQSYCNSRLDISIIIKLVRFSNRSRGAHVRVAISRYFILFYCILPIDLLTFWPFRLLTFWLTFWPTFWPFNVSKFWPFYFLTILFFGNFYLLIFWTFDVHFISWVPMLSCQ